MTLRALLLVALTAAALWFAAAVLVSGALIANGRASESDIVSALLCAGEFCLVAWVWTRVRRGRG